MLSILRIDKALICQSGPKVKYAKCSQCRLTMKEHPVNAVSQFFANMLPLKWHIPQIAPWHSWPIGSSILRSSSSQNMPVPLLRPSLDQFTHQLCRMTPLGMHLLALVWALCQVTPLRMHLGSCICVF